MKKLLAIIIFCSTFHLANAQIKQNFNDQIIFAKYLLKNNMAEDCILLLQKEMNISDYTVEQKDSIYNLLGHAYYNNNIYDSAAFYYSSVSMPGSGFNKSKFLSAYSFTLLKKYSGGIEQLKKVDTIDLKNKEFRDLQLSVIYLLSRDTSNFLRISKSFTYSYNDINEQEKKIIQLNNDLKKIKQRSGFLAGMMSAVVPGLGKVYAGKTRQGVSSFIPVTFMGLCAFEAYKKAGISSPRFILTSGLFSVFYIGNIWGSILSVSVSRNEKNDEINDQILFNLRIPLQKFLDSCR